MGILATGEKFKNHPRARDTATRVKRSSVATRTRAHARRDKSFARVLEFGSRERGVSQFVAVVVVKALKRARSVVEFCI